MTIASATSRISIPRDDFQSSSDDSERASPVMDAGLRSPVRQQNSAQRHSPRGRGGGELSTLERLAKRSLPAASVRSPVGSQAATPLAGVSVDELTGLIKQYDTKEGYVHQSGDANTRNAQKLADGLQQGMTGYPQRVIQFHRKQTELTGMLAELPDSERQFYAGVVATLAAAYELDTSVEQRDAIDQKFAELEDAVRGENTRVGNDPVERALSLFNAPMGEASLNNEDRQRVGDLAALREKFLSAPDAAKRQDIFRQASELKKDLQEKISVAIDSSRRTENAQWKEANGEVDRILQEAQAQTDPAKRYELIGRQLFEIDPGQDALRDKVVLAFTQRMHDSPELRDKLDTWHAQVSGPLNAQSVSAPKRYTDILNHLPPVSPDYVRDLSDQYTAVLKDASFKDYSITPAARATRLVTQILEGIARVMLGVTPLAPLTALLPSTLPEGVRMGLDYGSAFLGTLAGEGAGVLADVGRAGRAVSEASEEFGVAGERSGAAGEELAQTAGQRLLAASEREASLSHDAKAAEQALQAKTVGQAGPTFDRTTELVHRSAGDDPYKLLETYGETGVSPAELTPGPDAGVLVNADGDTFIDLRGKAYHARFDMESNRWRVFDKDASLKPQYPVHLNPRTYQWEPGNEVATTAKGHARLGVPKAYARRPDGELNADPDHAGIFRDPKGNAYIAAAGQTWPVRYDGDHGTWRVYRPDDPAKYAYPVRGDTEGNWRVHGDTGLPGGMDSGDSSPSGSGSPSGSNSPSGIQGPPFASAFKVTTPDGAAPSAAMQETLDPNAWHSPANEQVADAAYVQSYRTAFDHLPQEQRYALRDWTHLEEGDSDGYSSDGSSVDYEGINYDLNKQLIGGMPDAASVARSRMLQSGLSGLPKPAGPNRLLRFADVDPNYASKFKAGDYVTNSPAFMSASSANDYAKASLADEAGGSGPNHAVALYDIQSQSATPFVPSVNTLANDESEWLFKPNTVFKVEEVAVASPTDAHGTPRIGIRLVEVPFTEPVFAKNIHTGQTEMVYPPGQDPVYTQL